MDRTTKFILACIAAGLFANAAVQLRPLPALAQDSDAVTHISASISAIEEGNCPNHRICGS